MIDDLPFLDLENTPASQLPQREQLALNDLVFAERFLHGDFCSDPIRAHQITKEIHAAGHRQYPTLWELADRHMPSYEVPTL
jgi:hypothetical protein